MEKDGICDRFVGFRVAGDASHDGAHEIRDEEVIRMLDDVIERGHVKVGHDARLKPGYEIELKAPQCPRDEGEKSEKRKREGQSGNCLAWRNRRDDVDEILEVERRNDDRCLYPRSDQHESGHKKRVPLRVVPVVRYDISDFSGVFLGHKSI